MILSLNHTNESVRATGVTYMLAELNAKVSDNQKVSTRLHVDKEFIRGEVDTKLLHESSPVVIQSVLNFGVKLLDYFTLEQLLEDERYLLKLFTLDLSQVKLDDDSDEMRHNFRSENRKWEECRETALELIFSGLYSKYKDNKDIFFNCFLVMASRIFELNSTNLLGKLKSTQYYADLLTETRTLESRLDKIPIKSFYSKSSISVTKLATGVTTTCVVGSNGHAEDSESARLRYL